MGTTPIPAKTFLGWKAAGDVESIMEPKIMTLLGLEGAVSVRVGGPSGSNVWKISFTPVSIGSPDEIECHIRIQAVDENALRTDWKTKLRLVPGDDYHVVGKFRPGGPPAGWLRQYDFILIRIKEINQLDTTPTAGGSESKRGKKSTPADSTITSASYFVQHVSAEEMAKKIQADRHCPDVRVESVLSNNSIRMQGPKRQVEWVRKTLLPALDVPQRIFRITFYMFRFPRSTPRSAWKPIANLLIGSPSVPQAEVKRWKSSGLIEELAAPRMQCILGMPARISRRHGNPSIQGIFSIAITPQAITDSKDILCLLEMRSVENGETRTNLHEQKEFTPGTDYHFLGDLGTHRPGTGQADEPYYVLFQIEEIAR